MEQAASQFKIGFYWWDILIIAVIILVGVLLAMKLHKMKDEKRDMENRISELYTSDIDDELNKVK